MTSGSKKLFLGSFSEKSLQEKLEAGGNTHFDWFHVTEDFMYYAHDIEAKKKLLEDIEKKPLYWFYSEDIDSMVLKFIGSFMKTFFQESFKELTPSLEQTIDTTLVFLQMLRVKLTAEDLEFNNDMNLETIKEINKVREVFQKLKESVK